MMKLSAGLAVAFGACVAAAQLLRNWGNWGLWPTWAIDEFSSAVLIVAGLMALRGRSDRFLAPGWAFACGLFGSSLIGYWQKTQHMQGDAHAFFSRFMLIVAALFAATLVGLALSLIGPRKTA